MPWEKKYDDADLLEKAARAFWSRGYEATSMADLVAATGVNRGSIYSAFTDKRGLFRQALRHYDEIYRSRHLAELLMAHPPREAILAAFRGAIDAPADLPPGCLVVNSALELSPHDPAIARDVHESLEGLRSFFADRVTAARADGTLPAGEPAGSIADSLLALFLGVRVMARAGLAGDAGQRVLDQVEALLR